MRDKITAFFKDFLALLNSGTWMEDGGGAGCAGMVENGRGTVQSCKGAHQNSHQFAIEIFFRV
jgi:hypothetical protein